MIFIALGLFILTVISAIICIITHANYDIIRVAMYICGSAAIIILVIGGILTVFSIKEKSDETINYNVVINEIIETEEGKELVLKSVEDETKTFSINAEKYADAKIMDKGILEVTNTRKYYKNFYTGLGEPGQGKDTKKYVFIEN